MILIADSGSTKTDWCLIDSTGTNTFFTTEGINPYYAENSHIIQLIRNGIPAEMDSSKIEAVHFYGAGCQEDNTELMEEILRSVFINSVSITANVDLLAAARGL